LPGADIKATEAWDIYTGNPNNIIAIIDVGVDPSHSDLSGKVLGDIGYSGRHGTLMAGVAAANTNNGTGIAGLDWNAKILSKRYGDNQATYQAIVDAVNYSPNVHVLNNSYYLGSGYSTLVHLAAAYAYKNNRVFVTGMGNDGSSQIQYPAAFGQGIIAVGASTRFDALWVGSNTGNHIDVVASGEAVRTTDLVVNNSYSSPSGTSMAAPYVSGLASLLKGYNPSLANDDIENIIKLSADKVPAMQGQNFNTQFGAGRINARRALEYLQAPYQLYQLTATGGTDVGYTNAYIAPIYAIPGLATANYSVKRHEVQKTVALPSMSTAQVWGRGAFTNGYANSPSFGMGFCEPVGMTPTTVTLRTYCYEIWTINGQYLGWYPCQPSQVQYAYTVWGVPGTPPPSVTITGITEPPAYSFNSYTANITNGTAPFSYNWESNYGTGTWYSVGNTNPINFGGGDPNNYWTLRVTVTDAQGRQAQGATNIYFTGSGGPYSARPDNIDKPLPTVFSLDQNYPNPFNPSTTISYALPKEARVKLTVFDVLGREVETLVNETKSAGVYQAVFNSSRLSSGTYFYRLQAGEFVQTKKMILAK